ncbi:MAG: 2,3,4,5-tetrahydropyridine-2,6-dicarboxylate N-succinyltransferase [Bacteroidota bacterium]
MSLQERVETFAATPITAENRAAVQEAFEAVRDGLNNGSIRSASRSADGTWTAHTWVKQGILLGFKLGALVEITDAGLPFYDKDTYPVKPLKLTDKVRVVPGGSAIRTGTYVAPGVVCMPPMYINVGAYVDEGTMVDSHALVGSCAQIGKRVHLSAAVQIGGVIEPIGALPVIVEDDVFIGGGCGVYEGCIVRERAVLAPGVILTGSTRIYDIAQERIIERTGEAPLEVPKGAVVVPGTRKASSAFGEAHGLSLYAPVIVKYRDEKTDAATTLESALR